MANGNGKGVGFQTKRTQVLERYKAAGANFEARTKPYKSTRQFNFTVPASEAFPAGAGSTMAHAICRAAQIVEWFAYKVGDNIAYGVPGTTRQALEDDTNLSKPRQTNGIEDFVIEAISATGRSVRGAYPAAAYTGTDVDAINAYLGTAVMYDPAALALPPQAMSPFSLEHTLFEAIKPHVAIEFEWDRKRLEKIGTLDEIPEGGAKSFLKASGDPRCDNRYRIPEGYLWAAEGKPDSEFIVRGTVSEAVVVPISFVALMGAGALTKTLTNLLLDVTVRLHGLALGYPSGN